MKYKIGYTSLLAAIVAMLLIGEMVQAHPSPKIRRNGHRGHRYNYGVAKRNGLDMSVNEVDGETHRNPSCHETLICGRAHYSSSESRFRPIVNYRKNNKCSCDDGHRCVLTGNKPERKAYVFHCRKKELSNHMYQFPHYRG